jgi:hypothetical protein
MINASSRPAWQVSSVSVLGQFRRDLATEAWRATGITAVRHKDCDSCARPVVTMAERAGVSPARLRAVIGDNRDAMPPDVTLVWKFTRASQVRFDHGRLPAPADVAVLTA